MPKIDQKTIERGRVNKGRPAQQQEWRYEAETKTVRTNPGNHWVCSMDSWDGALDHEQNARRIAAAPRIIRAAHALLDAYGGDVPDWLREEHDDLLTALQAAA